MEQPLISIIVPVYNVEPYLARCVDSILCQTYRNIELILVDDGSPDNCGAICDQYAQKDSRVKVIHKENGGQASARNMALDIMTGDYVGFVDSDDYILPDMYESLYGAMVRNVADIAVCGVINDHFITKKRFQYFEGEKVYDRDGFMEAYLTTPYVGTAIWNKLYRKELWQGIRFPVLRAREDVAVLHHVYGNCHRAVRMGDCKYIQYIRPGSTEQKGFSDDLLVTVDIYRERKGYIEKNFPELRKYVELSVPMAYKSLMDNLLSGGKHDKAVFDELYASFCRELEKIQPQSEQAKSEYSKLEQIAKNPKAYIRSCRLQRMKIRCLNFVKSVGVKLKRI